VGSLTSVLILPDGVVTSNVLSQPEPDEIQRGASHRNTTVNGTVANEIHRGKILDST